MIIIKVDTSICGETHIEDFFKSLSYSASSREVYNVLTGGLPANIVAAFSDRVYFTDELGSDNEIIITLPGDVIVLGNSWDKYIRYDLDKNIVITPNEILKRFNLFLRRSDTDIDKEIVVSTKTIDTL